MLKLGYARLVYDIYRGIEVSSEREIVTVTGIDKQLVGEFSAESGNPGAEPYNNKGVRYLRRADHQKARKGLRLLIPRSGPDTPEGTTSWTRHKHEPHADTDASGGSASRSPAVPSDRDSRSSGP